MSSPWGGARAARRSTVMSLLIGLAAVEATAGEHDVIINEIHYRPLGGDDAATLEYAEIHNLGAAEVDLGGWRVSEGVDLLFPNGTVIPSGGFLVLSPDPQRARAYYGLGAAQVVGPYTGRLDNGGEIVALANAAGDVINRVHYVDRNPWPSLADGLGPSLEFTGTDNGNDLAGRWAASLVLGGTPGAQNSARREPPAPLGGGSTLVSATDDWRTFEGRSAPSTPAIAWAGVGFNDASWAVLPGPFGYGNGHGFTFATELDDMQFNYTTYYVRRSFDVDAETRGAILAGEVRLSLTIQYDDAFVAYLNGTEVGRDNVGLQGTPVPFDGTAGGPRAATLEIDLTPFAGAVRTGTNVLALQGVNNFIIGQDFFIGATLDSETVAAPPPAMEGPFIGGVLNEMRPREGDASPGFVELFNPGAAPLDLGGFFIISTAGLNATLPAGTSLAPGSYRAFDDVALATEIPAAPQVILLLRPDAATLADALEVDPRGNGNSFGRFPDGDGDTFVLTPATPGAANVYSYSSPVVINEVHFHPAHVPPEGACERQCSDLQQWIELWNRSAAPVDLTGWRLARGIEFSFAPATSIAPGAALVVAASAASFRAGHPGVANVVGDWTGRLAHDSDIIHLLNPLGNRADRVEYGDGGPLNDEEPEDGADDRTFRGSDWPSEADGSGRTLELLNPALENRLGLAWRASTAGGGTPGAANSVFTAAAAPVIGTVKHFPAVPRSTETVLVTCRISALAALTTSRVEWTADGGAGGTRPLSDDGLSGDGAAGDGVYGATIPAQPDGTVVAFQIRATDAVGRGGLAPPQPEDAPYNGFPGNFFLYEVDNTPPPANGQPAYRIVMRQQDREELQDRDVTSNVLLPVTFIGGDEVRYVAGLRFRGETSRREPNRSYRVNLASESAFDGLEHLNLNGSNGGLGISNAREVLCADLFRRAGAPYPQVVPVNLHFPGEVTLDFDPRYARKEAFDAEFRERFFGGSDHGNLYRARNPGGPGNPSGDLVYLGEDPAPYRPLYDKRSNEEEDDYTDIIELTRVFDPAQTPDGEFQSRLEALVDTRQWAQFFALQALISNIDGGIWNNNGEDYFLYHVPADAPRPDRGKWLLLPWDLEEVFANSNERLFRPDLATVRRFLTHASFAPLYYEELAKLREGVFSRFAMRQRYGFVSGMFVASQVFDVVDPIDSYVARRLGYIDANVAVELTAGTFSPPTMGERVIAAGETWRFFRGTSEPPGAAMAWTARVYAETGWDSGPTGIGYGDGDDQTTLDEMMGTYVTVFARKDFDIADPGRVSGLELSIDYDDAFIAYLNGVEVARSQNAPGAPGQPVAFDQEATETHEAGEPEPFDLPLVPGRLVAGRNVLALVGFNMGVGSTDFSLIPELFMTTVGNEQVVSGGCGDVVYTTGSLITLMGTVSAVGVGSVTANGQLASLAPITGGGGPYGAAWSVTLTLEAGDNLVAVETHPDVGGVGPVLERKTMVVRSASGFTAVGGVLAANTTWTRAGGPYRLVSSAEVPPGGALTIEAGTAVLADAGAGIIVRGRLTASGLEGDPIRFGAYHCDGRWNGIVFQDTGTGEADPTHTLRHCILEGGGRFQNAGGFIAPTRSKVLLEDCTVRGITANALDGTEARVEVRSSLFEHVMEGVHCTSSDVILLDSTFREIIGDSDAIDFDFNGTGRSRIAGCLVESSSDDGIDLASTTVDIVDNVIRGVGDKAISLEGNGPLGAPTLQGNVIHDSGTGIALKDGVTVMEAAHNTVTRCQQGLDLFAKDAGPDGGLGVFHSSIIWGNGVDVRVDEKSSATFSFSDIGGAGSWPGEGNVAASPRFVSPEEGDFALAAGSPCIGTGLQGSDMGAIPFEGAEPIFLRGDGNGSGRVDLSDGVYTLNHLFLGGPRPACLDVLDSNDDGALNLTDGVYTLNHLFLGGPSIAPPYPAPGPDPTPDSLPCGGA